VAHEASDLAAASHTLATSLPEGEQRRTFLRTLTLVQPAPRSPSPRATKVQAPAAAPAPAAARTAAQRAPARPTEGLGGTQPLLGTLYLGEEVLKRAELRLARLLGPMARAMVRRAAKDARNATELYAALAEELPEGPERDGFLASRDKN
jgi:eukaryotic-like serine/threonine-protein kinase